MERRTIKLPTGYLNVDATDLTFTRSGNWAEAERTAERKSAVTFGSTMRILVGAALLFVAALGAIVKADPRGGGNSAILVTLGLGFLSFVLFFQKLKDGFLTSFKIPFPKMRSVRSQENGIIIEFVNAGWKEDRAEAKVNEADGAFSISAWESTRTPM